MMKAAVLTSFQKPLEIQQVKIPKPGPNDVLVKLIACGVCHTDIHIARADVLEKPELPLIMGHEGIGEVVEMGSNVDSHLMKKGDIIGVPLMNSTCHHCEYCSSGRESFCSKQICSGYSIDGCFAEYTLINAEFGVKLPQGMDPYKSAPLFCAGVTMYKALKIAEVRPGEWVSIIGAGGLGSVGIRFAVAMGMRVLVVVAPNDKNAVRLSKEMGAEEVYDGPADKHGEWVQGKVGGVQASIVTVPLSVAFEQAVKSVKRGGHVVAIGLSTDTMTLSISDFVENAVQLIGSLAGTRKDLQEALELARIHKITCHVEKRKLEDINQVFDDMLNYKISGRIVIDFSAN